MARGGLDGDVGLESAVVRFTVKNRPGEVRVFDPVHVGDQDVADAEQGQVFNDFVAQRPAPTTRTLAAESLD